MTIDVPAGLSTFEADLYRHLATHVATESALLEQYRDVAEGATGYVGYLLGLIGDDEERHHRLFTQWMRSIEAMAELRESPEGIPSVTPGPIDDALVPALAALLDNERADADELKHLERQLKDFREVTLWPLIVQMMELDTRKHQLILEFLLRHTGRS